MIAIENHGLPNVFPQAVEAEIASAEAADAARAARICARFR